MATIEELQQHVAALSAQVAAITAPPTDYYTSQYDGEEIDAAIERALPGGAIDASLSNKAEFNGGFLQSGSILDLAESKTLNTHFATNSAVTGLPFFGFWCVDYYFYPAGNWRILIATEITTGMRYFTSKNGVNLWTPWKEMLTSVSQTEYDLPLSGVTGTVKYSKSQDSKVLITSLCVTASAALSAGATIATLPAGYYPPWEIKVLADIGGQLGRVIISTAGVVAINKTAAQGAEICTGSISFVAAS